MKSVCAFAIRISASKVDGKSWVFAAGHICWKNGFKQNGLPNFIIREITYAAVYMNETNNNNIQKVVSSNTKKEKNYNLYLWNWNILILNKKGLIRKKKKFICIINF